MPGLDDLAVLQELRRGGCTTPVMMITGSDDLALARRCLDLGACDYITKPLDLDYLGIKVWAKITTALPPAS